MLKKVILLTLILMLLAGASLTPHPAPTQAQEEVEIIFTHIFPDERDVRRETIRAIADEFEALHPGVTVTIQTSTEMYEDVFDAALRGMEQGNPPHVVQIEDTLMQQAIDSEGFVRIGDYASEEQLASIQDILPNVRNFYNLDEEIWGLPWNASNPVFYINPVYFEQAGLDPTNPPTTFAEIEAACDALMNAGIERLEGCVNWVVSSWIPEQWLAMQNAMFMNNDNGRAGRATEAYLTSPEMMNIMNWWDSMADKGYYIYTGNLQDYYGEGLMFITGRTAMHINTSAGISNIIKFGNSMGQFDPVVLPLFRPHEDANNGITVGGGAVWVTAGHSEAETQAAVDFAFFLLEPENMAAWHMASGYFPVTQSAIDLLDTENWFEANPYYAIPLDQVLAAEPNLANAGTRSGAYPLVREALMAGVQSFIDGDTSPDVAMEAAEGLANEAIAEYNSFFE